MPGSSLVYDGPWRWNCPGRPQETPYSGGMAPTSGRASSEKGTSRPGRGEQVDNTPREGDSPSGKVRKPAPRAGAGRASLGPKGRRPASTSLPALADVSPSGSEQPKSPASPETGVPRKRLAWFWVALWLAVVGVACLAGMLASLPRRVVLPDPSATRLTVITEAPVEGLSILVTKGEPVPDENNYTSTWTMEVTVRRSQSGPLPESQRTLSIRLDGTDYRVNNCPPDPDSSILTIEGYVDCLSTGSWPEDGSDERRSFKIQAAPGHFGWQSDDRRIRGGFPQVLLKRGGASRGVGFPVSYSADFSDSGSDPTSYTWTPRGDYGISSGFMTWELSDPGSAAVRGATEAPDFEGESPAAADRDEQRTFLAGALAGVGGGALMAAVQKLLENIPSWRRRPRNP